METIAISDPPLVAFWGLVLKYVKEAMSLKKELQKLQLYFVLQDRKHAVIVSAGM